MVLRRNVPRKINDQKRLAAGCTHFRKFFSQTVRNYIFNLLESLESLTATNVVASDELIARKYKLLSYLDFLLLILQVLYFLSL